MKTKNLCFIHDWETLLIRNNPFTINPYLDFTYSTNLEITDNNNFIFNLSHYFNNESNEEVILSNKKYSGKSLSQPFEPEITIVKMIMEPYIVYPNRKDGFDDAQSLFFYSVSVNPGEIDKLRLHGNYRKISIESYIQGLDLKLSEDQSELYKFVFDCLHLIKA